MQNTIRVRKNAPTKAASLQTKTARPQPTLETVRILLADDDGKIEADFEIPKAMHEAMQHTAQIKGVSVREWIENAVRDKIESVKNPPAVHPFTELEFAKEETNALMQLIAYHMDYQSRDGGGFSGPEVSAFCGGINLLVGNTRDRLNKAFDALHKSVKRNSEVAS